MENVSMASGLKLSVPTPRHLLRLDDSAPPPPPMEHDNFSTILFAGPSVRQVEDETPFEDFFKDMDFSQFDPSVLDTPNVNCDELLRYIGNDDEVSDHPTENDQNSKSKDQYQPISEPIQRTSPQRRRSSRILERQNPAKVNQYKLTVSAPTVTRGKQMNLIRKQVNRLEGNIPDPKPPPRKKKIINSPKHSKTYRTERRKNLERQVKHNQRERSQEKKHEPKSQVKEPVLPAPIKSERRRRSSQCLCCGPLSPPSWSPLVSKRSVHGHKSKPNEATTYRPYQKQSYPLANRSTRFNQSESQLKFLPPEYRKYQTLDYLKQKVAPLHRNQSAKQKNNRTELNRLAYSIKAIEYRRLQNYKPKERSRTSRAMIVRMDISAAHLYGYI